MSMTAADIVRETEDLTAYLEPTRHIDSDHPGIVAFAEAAVGDTSGQIDKALKLYYAVRDQIFYDPYNVEMTDQGFTASDCLAKGYGFCILKAALLAAVARAAGIPARVGFADVRNHLATRRLIEMMGTDTFYYHGFTELYLEGKWVKATPAFNIELCDKFKVLPLDFDGRADSIFHPFDAEGKRHMEYVADRGAYADVPFDEIRACFRREYPIWGAGEASPTGDFAAEAEAEN